MNYKAILFLLAASILICVHLAEAQQPGKIFRIGFLDQALLPVARSSWTRSGKS